MSRDAFLQLDGVERERFEFAFLPFVHSTGQNRSVLLQNDAFFLVCDQREERYRHQLVEQVVSRPL